MLGIQLFCSLARCIRSVNPLHCVGGIGTLGYIFFFAECKPMQARRIDHDTKRFQNSTLKLIWREVAIRRRKTETTTHSLELRKGSN